MDINERLARLALALKIEERRARLQELQSRQTSGNFWADQQRAASVVKESAFLVDLIHRYDAVAALANGAESEEELEEVLGDDLVRLEREAWLSGPFDSSPAILSFYAGAGGTDAQDWTAMLLAMYQRYVETGRATASRADWRAELLHSSPGEEAGLKSATLLVSGKYAFGLLKGEAGVHRLVRQSPFNAKGLRQTSFALVDVIPERPPAEVELAEADIRVDVFRSSGPGGQSVNTTDSAVRLTHLPTGLSATVQDEKSQHKNKEKARRILVSRLAARLASEQQQKISAERGDLGKNEWGSQIRSYILYPYTLVKDHRTGTETADAAAVLGGNLDDFIWSELTQNNINNSKE